MTDKEAMKAAANMVQALYCYQDKDVMKGMMAQVWLANEDSYALLDEIKSIRDFCNKIIDQLDI